MLMLVALLAVYRAGLYIPVSKVLKDPICRMQEEPLISRHDTMTEAA
jgi:hypothetical protein